MAGRRVGGMLQCRAPQNGGEREAREQIKYDMCVFCVLESGTERERRLKIDVGPRKGRQKVREEGVTLRGRGRCMTAMACIRRAPPLSSLSPLNVPQTLARRRGDPALPCPVPTLF